MTHYYLEVAAPSMGALRAVLADLDHSPESACVEKRIMR